MKTFKNGIILSILILSNLVGFTQCDNEFGVFICADKLMMPEVIYLSDFPVNTRITKNLKRNNGLSWDVYLNENTNYRFALCCNEGLSDIVMKLYGSPETENTPYASTFDGKTDNEKFDFICKKSGFYKVSIRFKKKRGIGKKLCAIGLMGYIGKIR